MDRVQEYFPVVYTAATATNLEAMDCYPAWTRHVFTVMSLCAYAPIGMSSYQQLRANRRKISVVILLGTAASWWVVGCAAIANVRNLIQAIKMQDLAQMQKDSVYACLHLSAMAPLFTVSYPLGKGLWDNTAKPSQEEICGSSSQLFERWWAAKINLCLAPIIESERSFRLFYAYKMGSLALFAFSVSIYSMRFASYTKFNIAMLCFSAMYAGSYSIWRYLAMAVLNQLKQQEFNNVTLKKSYARLEQISYNEVQAHSLLLVALMGLEPLITRSWFGKAPITPTLFSTDLWLSFMKGVMVIFHWHMGYSIGEFVSQRVGFSDEQIQKISQAYHGIDASPYTVAEQEALNWIKRTVVPGPVNA